LTRFIDDGRIETPTLSNGQSGKLPSIARTNSSQYRMLGLTLCDHRIAHRDRQGQGCQPLAYLPDVITRIVNGHPDGKIDDPLPWA
jgi:hypothetical protein